MLDDEKEELKEKEEIQEVEEENWEDENIEVDDNGDIKIFKTIQKEEDEEE